MRSTTPFVWIAAALVLLTGIFPGTNAFGQFQFNGDTVRCLFDPNDGTPNVLDSQTDSLEVLIYLAGPQTYADNATVVFNPLVGWGTVPGFPQSFDCPFGGYEGRGMQVTLTPNMGLDGNPDPDSCRIVGRFRFRPQGISGTNIPVTFRFWARAIDTSPAPDDTICGSSELYNRVIPCEVDLSCGYFKYEEICGFYGDDILAINDEVWLDTMTVNGLDDALEEAEGQHDTIFVDFRHITCDEADSMVFVGTKYTVVQCSLENDLCGDVIEVRRLVWTGDTWPPDPEDIVSNTLIEECILRVDNQEPNLIAGMIDSFRVLNGNYIDNPDMVGCCDTLRIYMATDSSLLSEPAFDGAVEGATITDPVCLTEHDQNFDMSYVAVWLGDFVGDAFENDTSLYPDNSVERGLLCPADSFLWIGVKFVYSPVDGNNLMWVDIPFCPEYWAEIQACILDKLEALDTIYVWGLDDAGNRTQRLAWIPSLAEGRDLCFDNVPPTTPLGSDIYLSAGYCVKRFSPYDSLDFNQWRLNLSPDSIVWRKDRLDEEYTDIFNDLYLVGFDARTMPEDTAPMVRLDWLHPDAPVIDFSLDTFRWGWVPGSFDGGFGDAFFTWYGKFGTDSIDPWLDDVYSSISDFWKCEMGGGLTVGITFARWMDQAGCNRILGWDYDGSTDLDDGYTHRNQIVTILDMCPPAYTSAADSFRVSNLTLGLGAPHLGIPTYLWNGPNGDPDVDDPILTFRPRRNFAQNPFDVCMDEDTFFYRVRIDTIDLIGAVTTWPGANDSVRWYHAGDPITGTGDPTDPWRRILFNAGDIDGPVVSFEWGHSWNPYLPDGLYQLTLELRDDAGNVMLDSIYIWLNGAGPVIEDLMVVNMDTVCTINFYTNYTQDTVGVWIQTDTTADAVLIDWTCFHNVDPADDSTWATYVGTDGVSKQWFGYLVIDGDNVSDVATENVYEISPFGSLPDTCENVNNNRVINVRAFDIMGDDTLFSEVGADDFPCDLAIIGISPCPLLIGLDQYFYFADPDSPQTLAFGHEVDEWGAISPGKLDSANGFGEGSYNSLTNWANDTVQDSVFIRLLIDSASVRPDTLDTLVLQFINPTIYPPETEPRVRELRKALFRPTSSSLTPDPTIRNTIFDGFIERDDDNEAFIEFRYFWNGTWFIGAGQDSIMLVPYDQQDTIIVRAFMIAVDTIDVETGDTIYSVCDTFFIDSLDIDNINPKFRTSTLANNWSGWVGPGHDPITGSTQSVQNLGWDADGDGEPEDCGFRFGDGEPFRLRVKMTEWLHHNDDAYPNQLGSHNDAGGYWPTPNDVYRGAWQISPIDIRTEDVFAFGPNLGDSAVVVLDSVVVDTVSVDSVYYVLHGHFEFPAAATAWFLANSPVVDSVALVIRAAWDQAGNPGRYNNPVWGDGLTNDSAEDTTFWVTLVTSDPWAAGCPLVWGRPTTVHGWTAPDSLFGWIAAEEDSVIVWATIIETPELAFCAPGVYADSAHVVEGNFQPITDDPNPWVLPNEVGDWFIYVDPETEDTLGWARKYKWYLRADSADLATIHCDGAFLPFWLHLTTYGGVNSYKLFDNCVQVDVNEPLWADEYTIYNDTLEVVTACIPAMEPFWISKYFHDDGVDCPNGDGVGVDTTLGNILADLSILLGNAAMDSVPPDCVIVYGPAKLPAEGIAFWYVSAVDPIFQCVDSAQAMVKFYALTDSVGHYDRELFHIDTLYLCSDCVPPYVGAINTFCSCDTGFVYLESLMEGGPETACTDRGLAYVTPGGELNLQACFRDVDGDSSSGIDTLSIEIDLSEANPLYVGWISANLVWALEDTMVWGFWGWESCQPDDFAVPFSTYYLRTDLNNGDTVFATFRVCDFSGNCSEERLPIAIVDSLPPIVDYIYTIGDDSIRAYVTPGDQHIHLWADINGYVGDLLSAPSKVWADFRNFHCGDDSAAYDTVYASYIEQIDENTYRAYWGWYPPEYWSEWDDLNSFVIGDPVLGDSLVPGSDTLKAAYDLCDCAFLGAEGFYDTLWIHVQDAACNEGIHYSVFELSGCDSTTPSVDFIEIWGNGCKQGWISSTPLDSGHVEVWAWMDTTFNDLSDTLRIDSMQADLSQLSPLYAATAWSTDLKGGAPVYGYAPDSSLINGVLDTDGALLLPTYWDIITVPDGEGSRDRLVAKWVLLHASDLGCLDTVFVPVKAMRQTGLGGSHGYYIDVEYGWARVDTTRPVIYDMRVHSSTTSINETTWVSPNVPLFVDVWAFDTNCDTITDHLGFDLDNPDGPFIRFCDPTGGFDTIWTWTLDTPDSIGPVEIINDTAWVFLRWIGQPIYNDTCNAIDLDNITGCIEANIEDCLSNPAVPVQRQVTTDDRPPEFVYALPWGDFTHVTGFPGNPDLIGVDSVLVLQNSVYALDWDSVLVVNVVVDNFPGDTLISWAGTYINFAGFLTTPIQYPDEIFFNIDGNHRDSLVWIIPLYDAGGGGPLFNVNILSDRYWYPLILADTMTNNTGDPWDEQPDPFPMTLFCDDLDSVISFTIQNWNSPNPGMILICDSNTVAGSDTDFVDANNMALWNNEFVSPDAEFENLYKIYYAPGQWSWYSHEDVNQTRFFIFVEDTVLQSDGIDNDHDGLVDEIGEGVDFYTADLRINDFPQVGHVDSMNVDGVWINYLWFADNFDEQRYDVDLFISDIYGHRDTLTNLCEGYNNALRFFEDESCPVGQWLEFWKDGERLSVRMNGDLALNGFDLPALSADDSLFVFADFDSISLIIEDPIFLIANHPGSGPDLDTTTVDSINFNNGTASSIELLDPLGNPVAGFVQRYWDDATIYASGPLTFVDPTEMALAGLPDGWYTIRATMLDRVGNSCVRDWSFRLDRTCPVIDPDLTFVTRPGQNTPVVDLFTSWDYVEIVANVADSLDGVDSVFFEYCFDANRDGNLDAYPYWQTINILSDEGGAWDTDYPFIVYWNIRNLPWSSEDTLGLPPVNPDTCMNRYFVRVRAKDVYGHECLHYWPVDITDDVAPLAFIERIARTEWDWDWTPQGAVISCYNPNENLGDSLAWVVAYDFILPGYDPEPGDTFGWANHWFDLQKGVFQYKKFDAPDIQSNDPYLGWVNMWTPGQDTATYRNYLTERFYIQWNLIHPIERVPLNSGQYNLRFVAIDVCGNADPLNTPVITVRMECDTTAPIAVICYPDYGARVTNYRCDDLLGEYEVDLDTGWVAIKSASAIWSDVDSVAFFFIDSLSVPGLAIHSFIGGDGNPEVLEGVTYGYTRWNTNNLLSGWYTLYAVAYDNGGLFDTDPILHRLYVDNTMPTVEYCYPSVETTWDGEYFYLYAYPSDPDGGDITAVWFQYLSRAGNWINLPDGDTEFDVWSMYGADIYASANPVMSPLVTGEWRIMVNISNFDQSPLDSIRFRAIALDRVDIGSPNLQGDYNRDCNVDRDLTCGDEVCCMAVEIRDQIPSGTNLWGYNHGNFAECCLPNIDNSTAIVDCDVFSTCDYRNPLDTLLLVAKVDPDVEDGWLMHFKFRRAWPEEAETPWEYVPNNTTVNPWIPALGPIVLYHTWDSVYVIWTDVRNFIETADAAAGLTYSVWEFAAQVEDLTGNVEAVMDQNMLEVRFACVPSAPITAAGYVRNPDRERIEEQIIWNDFVSDTIEVLYNRTTGPGENDPEALVLLYTDASSILNCRNQVIEPFNLQLWLLDDGYQLGRVCPSFVLEPFHTPIDSWGFDQYPPDDGSRYVVGMYLDNNFPPGVYNFAMIVRTNEVYYPCDTMFFYEGDSDLSGDFGQNDSTRIDIVIRVVNVNEPQITFCYPEYGATCVHGTVPMSASLVDNPEFTGEVDTVWFQYFDGSMWQPIADAITGLTYDVTPNEGAIRFELDESEVVGMAGWYYDMSVQNTDLSMYAWYAERDLFPDVWVWVMGVGYREMTRDANGMWTADVDYPYNVGQCTSYAFVIDANDNNVFEGPEYDRWIADPRDACQHGWLEVQPYGTIPVSEVCACEWLINFPSRDYLNTSYNFRTVVGWHDEVAYHVIENPSLGDSIHVFFVDNEPAEATHDIEFDVTRLSGGMLSPSDQVCNPADTLRFVTDIQPLGTYGLVVEDICMVIYQVSLTNDPFANDAWINVDTVLSNDDMGWTEAWPGYWVAWNPLSDNLDNDGDGLVDETYDVQAGDGVGEENTKYWTRSVVRDYCGNTYYSEAESIWVDVSAPQACVTQVGDVAPADNQVVIIPADRQLMIIATDMSYADPGILATFQYRRLGVPPQHPAASWRDIETTEPGDALVRHVGDTYTATWDLFEHQWRDTADGYWNDPEGWFQLRAVAEDTVGNNDLCDNVVCQITIRLNDIQPAARVEVYEVYSVGNPENAAISCTEPDIWYIHQGEPYCIRAIFAPTNIDTGLASLTFQYRSLYVEGDPSEWRNLETIYDYIDWGLNGDTTRCVSFQPRPDEIGEHGFDLRVIVEDYNGNDTSNVVTLYVDDSAPEGVGTASPSIAFTGPCGDRCRLDQDGNPLVTAIFEPDAISGEVNVDEVWLTVVRDDDVYAANLGSLDRSGPDTWTFDFDGDLCAFWIAQGLDMGCYYFTLHFTDCVGNEGSVAVTTTCGEGEATELICIDCVPGLPEFSELDYMDYYGWDCAEESYVELRDNVLDGTTEIGGDHEGNVTICGHIPAYQQYIGKVWLFVESEDAEIESTLVDTHEWLNTGNSATDTTYCFSWYVGERDDENMPVWPSGYYRVWVLATDAICQLQSGEMVDEFWVHVDNTEPIAEITQINGVAPNPMGPDTFEVFSGQDDPSFLWVDWMDGLDPDDAVQAHNQVQVWAKIHEYPSEGDTVWHQVGYIPSPCNPHFVLWNGFYTCGETLDLVAIAADRWGNGEFTIERVREAYAAGRYVDVIIVDRVPPATELWSIGLNDEPTDDDETQVVNQQNSIVHLSSNFWDQDVWLHAFSTVSDPSIERVYFQYSMDGETWIDIATDDNPDEAPDCEGWSDPIPWWCETSEEIMWTALWDISGLSGHLWVRVWGQDVCGNVEDFNVYEVTIDVAAPMAKVFAWLSDVNVGDLPCYEWSEPQIGDDLERFSTLTLGACPDSMGTVHYDAYGARWFIKRADENPIDYSVWCELGDDSTGPFSLRPVDLWDNECVPPQPGVWYDMAVRMSDQNGHTMPWEQMLYFAEGTTWQEKWQDLINRGYVKRFRVVDHTAPVTYNLTAAPDCTPDSSVMFLHGDVTLTATCDARDVVAVTFAVREMGAEGPWTIIERASVDTGMVFMLAEITWNTELLNGTYILGAFGEDEIGNMDGDPNVADQWPTNTLTVNVDNQPPSATIVQVLRNGVPVTELERGAVHTFDLNASDNFGLRSVSLYIRHSGGDPDGWTLIGTDDNWPYSFNWMVPVDLVVGWTYDFMAVATDLCYWTDMTDGQGNYIIDWAGAPIVDTEANIAIVTIGGQDAETVPHVHGTNIEVVAHSEPMLDYVRFVWVRDGDTTEIRTIAGAIGDTVWTLTNWDVTTIPEGPAQLCAIGSADLGGELVTLATDCRNIVIDHSVPVVLGETTPASHGLIGGTCGTVESGNTSIGFIMDYSGSMGDGDIADMETAVHGFIANMRQGDRGAVVKFDGTVTVVQDFTGDLQALDAAVDASHSRGSTALYQALYEGANLIAPETQRRALILLTDGYENASSVTLQQAIGAAVASNAVVFTIGLGEVNEPEMQQIATATGGSYFHAPTSQDLAAIYAEIAATILTGGPQLDDVIVEFLESTDPMIDTVYFEWKWAPDPDDPMYWFSIGQAVRDQLSGTWSYQWNAFEMECGRITLRAVAWDASVPEPNMAYVIFADSVRVDNCDPIVAITNVNGDVTPEGTEIAHGTVAHIVATVTDAFANGGNSDIVRVDFYYRVGNEMIFLGSDMNGEPWEAYWNTSSVPYGTYSLVAEAFDEAGNCATDENVVNIVDRLSHRAYIVGWDADNEAGCDDNIWAITDDCTPDVTNHVMFEYSTDGGESWITLSTDNSGELTDCPQGTYYRLWSTQLEFDAIPMDAIFRAVAFDNAGNFDDNPPRWRRSDVELSPNPVVYNPEAARVPAHPSGQMPWVFSMLEDFTENCQTNVDLVCVRPSEPNADEWVGRMPSSTTPCNALTDRDSRVTIFRGVPMEEEGGLIYMDFTNYNLAIHQITFEDGSNGWLPSESGALELYVPMNATTSDGILWFEPVHEMDYVNLIPPSQHYYTLISDVEVIVSSGLESPSYWDDNWNEIRIRMRFDPANLPQGYEPWQIVPTIWDNDDNLWSERGIIYVNRDQIAQGIIDFEYSVVEEDWDPSDWYTALHSCYQIRLAVMYSTVRPIDEYVRFASSWCDLVPDSTYYTPERGPSVGCDVTWWAVLRQGEYTPPENTIDVYLDGIRIINDGRPDRVNGCDESGTPLFTTWYNTESGVYSVAFSYEADFYPPWYASGCLRNGQHTIQFYTNNLHTNLTPFWVDRTEPTAWTYPEYINHQVNLWANLTDGESGVDTTSVYAVISDCTPSAFTFRALIEVDTIWFRYYDQEEGYMDSLIMAIDSFTIGFELVINEPTRAFAVGSEAMTFTPIDGGYRADFSVQWEALQQWLIENNNAGTMCVTWRFHNDVCSWNDSTTYRYTIDVEPPMVIPVSPIGAAIDDDGDGIANEDWRDCINNDNDWWWDAEHAHWQERIDEDPINFEPDTLMFGERPTIQAVINDLAMCGSGASGVNVAGLWMSVDGQIFTIADTANAALNFHVMWPYGQQDDAYFLFGGTDNTALDPFYIPGEHRISVAAPDSAGNVGSYQFSWTYYIRSSGPAISFDPPTGACGVWFNPEITNEFGFCVDGTAGIAIAPNGIEYTVKYVPSGQRISGPTTINPTDPMHHCVDYILSGSFPDGQTGIEIEVVARNIHYNPQVDTLNGVNRSSMTFWADNLQPNFTNFMPYEGETFTRDEAVVIEVFYNDDSPAGILGGDSRNGDGSVKAVKTSSVESGKAEVRMGRMDKNGEIVPIAKTIVDLPADMRTDRGGNGSLDDNGSGTNVATFRMSIIPPNGIPIVPSPEDFIELDGAHAKYVLTPGQLAGRYTVNARIEDCVGNIGATAWNFFILSAAPGVTFETVEGECQYGQYWNPNAPLSIRATVREVDGVNISADGIRIDIVRMYACETGLCSDTVLHNATFSWAEGYPDPANTGQVFVIEGNYNLNNIGPTVELRVILTATNMQGISAVRVQPWIIDATAPWITILSPLPNTVWPQGTPVRISANFGDEEADGLLAMLPGVRKGTEIPTPTSKVGPQRDVVGKEATVATTESKLGSWGRVVSSGLDELDGDSGVDPACIELLLVSHAGGDPINLTSQATITTSNITWIGALEPGDYTAILSVCDRVCNVEAVNWDFEVGHADTEAPIIELLRPQPTDTISAGSTPTFDVKFTDVGSSLLDRETIHVWLETANSELVPATMDVNVDATGREALVRLTVSNPLTNGTYVLYAEGADTDGNRAEANWTFTVYATAPVIELLRPSPADTIAAGTTPTFDLRMTETGTSTLNRQSIRVWMESFNGPAIETTLDVNMNALGTEALIRMTVSSPLARGTYVLYGECENIAGNRGAANWTFIVSGFDAPDVIETETAYNYPNPFEYGEETHFVVPISGGGVGSFVRINIYDFAGQHVRKVFEGTWMNIEPVWDGRNEDGEFVANGVYLAQVVTQAGGQTKEDIVKVAFKNKK